jgi:signal transduction histidine kinase
MALALALASAASLVLFASLYHHEITSERRAAPQRLGAFLQITLENAMLKRDLPGLTEIVSKLGAVEGVAGVDILSPGLEVRFSSDPARKGQTIASLDALCPDCGLSAQRPGAASAFVTQDGTERLRAVSAVANLPPCAQCHGSASQHPVNGFLVVDYAAGDIKARAFRTAGALAGAGLLVTGLALATGYGLLRRRVVRPVERLTQDARGLLAGPGAQAAAPVIGDEIQQLRGAFDEMSRRLRDTLAEVRERDDFLQGVMDAIPDGVRVIRDDYTVVAANREFVRQSGFTAQEVLAAPCFASSHGRTEPCVATLVVCPLAKLAKDDAPLRCMHAHRARGDAADFPVEVTAASVIVQTREGPRRFVVESIRDLTQTMAVSQQQRLSEIGQLATGVAHEIHNPLASVRFGLTALEAQIASKPEPDEALGYLKLVSAEVERCIDITGRLMRLSQSQSGRGALIDLHDVARDVVSLLSYESVIRRIDLRISGFENARVLSSQADLGMALVNLVQNAFHATPEFGLIALRGRSEGDVVIVEISDSGGGIAPENLARIFQPFWTDRADQTSGSGLGLPITKAIVEKWGGAIAVRSRLGEGSTFTITLPHAAAAIEE